MNVEARKNQITVTINNIDNEIRKRLKTKDETMVDAIADNEDYALPELVHRAIDNYLDLHLPADHQI